MTIRELINILERAAQSRGDECEVVVGGTIQGTYDEWEPEIDWDGDNVRVH